MRDATGVVGRQREEEEMSIKHITLKDSISTITPDEARLILMGNRNNRNPNLQRVSEYARQIRAGEWQDVHQGILLGKNGELIDGQHRLLAIIKANIPARLVVFIDESISTPRGVQIDEGAARAGHWTQGVTRDLWEIANVLSMFGARCYHNASSRSGKPPRSLTEKISVRVSPYFSMLSTGDRRGFSTAKIRSAAVLAMMQKPQLATEVADQYKYLIADQRIEMWPVVEAFDKETVAAMIKGDKVFNPVVSMIRAHRAFSAVGQKRDSKMIKVFDYKEAFLAVRAEVDAIFAVELEPYKSTRAET